jgi:serine/threonine-protein kinase
VPKDDARPGYLDSWKAIAAHLRRTVRTVQRWERTSDLPVHRHEHRTGSSVYAYAEELDIWWSTRRPDDAEVLPLVSPPPAGVLRIAVLPFADLSPDGGQAHVCAGLGEELVAALSAVGSLRVTAPSSVARVLRLGRDLPSLASRLGIRLLIEGSLRRDDDRIRVTARLVNALDGDVLWCEQYDRQFDEILELQTNIAAAVAERTRLTTDSTERQPLRTRGFDSPVQEAYLRGRQAWNRRTEDGFRQAIEYFQHVIDAAPLDPRGYAGLAQAYTALSGNEFWAPHDGYPRGKAAATQALEIDPQSIDARTALAMALVLYDWDWPRAESEFLTALDLNPSSANAYHWYGLALLSVGRLREGTAAIARAHALDPLSPVITANLGRPYWCLRQYDRAVAFYRRGIDLAPELWLGHAFLAWALVEMGQFAEAEDAALTAIDRSGGNSSALATLADVRAAAGNRQLALETLDEILARREKGRYGSAFRIARVYARLADADATFDWLDRAHTERSLGSTSFLLYDAVFDRFRDRPRFAEYLKALRLSVDRR